MTLNEWLRNTTKRLLDAGIDSARLDALILLEDTLGMDRAHLIAYGDEAISPVTQATIDPLLTRRAKHEPLAYIRGRAEFYGRTFTITPDVLVPRPESESMIELLCSVPAARVLDVGTGSGALGITAALEYSSITIDLLDISAAALTVATGNAQKYSVRTHFLCNDLLTGIAGYDTLLCNLPYVPTNYPINSAASREPPLALYGGTDGLDLYRRLFSQTDATHILTECLESQFSSLIDIASMHGYAVKTTAGLCIVFEKSPV